MIYRYMQLIPERPATPNLDRWYAAISSRAGIQGADRGRAAVLKRLLLARFTLPWRGIVA